MKFFSPILCAALATAALLSGCDDQPNEVPYDDLSILENSCWTGVLNDFGYALIFDGERARLYSTNGSDDTAQVDDCTGRWTIDDDQFAIYDPANDAEPLCSYLWKFVNADGIPTITLGDAIKLTQHQDAAPGDAPALAQAELKPDATEASQSQP